MKKHNIEQQTPEWFAFKDGKVSGTFLKRLVGTAKAREDAFYELLGQRLSTNTSDPDEHPLTRGIRLEPEARAVFELNTGKKVYQIGVCENEKESRVIYSPDGYIIDSDDTEDTEFKCPGSKVYVRSWLKNEIPEEYYAQIIQAFIVNENLKTKYLVFYNPDIPIHPMHIIIVKRADHSKAIDEYRDIELEVLNEVDQKVEEVLMLYPNGTQLWQQ